MNVDTGFFQLLHEKRSVTDVCVRAQQVTSAHYEDLPFYWCRLYFSKTFIFSSNQRVNGTTAGKCAGPFCHASEAARENICWIIPGGRKITMMRSRNGCFGMIWTLHL